MVEKSAICEVNTEGKSFGSSPSLRYSYIISTGQHDTGVEHGTDAAVSVESFTGADITTHLNAIDIITNDEQGFVFRFHFLTCCTMHFHRSTW